MKTELSHFIRQLQNNFNGRPWYGDSLLHKLENISSSEAFMAPVPGTHSVAQLTAHIIVWRRYLLERLKGNPQFKVEIDTELDWPSQETLRLKGWEAILSELAENQRELLALLAAETNELLDRPFDGKRTFRSLIEGIIQHDIYHTGQIGLLVSLINKNKLL
jgi:uncharacterized damage-inducible protein DinB